MVFLFSGMTYLNVEIKAHCHYPDQIREYLKNNDAEFKGIDDQTDTYFNVAFGRLKLREGTIENNLIFYERENKAGPKNSNFQLVKVRDAKGLKEVLIKSTGIKMIVKKKREIWFIGNVKFHIDEIPELGWFVEIEAGNLLSNVSKEKLQEQCDFYLMEFKIKTEDVIAESYSDMLMELNNAT